MYRMMILRSLQVKRYGSSYFSSCGSSCRVGKRFLSSTIDDGMNKVRINKVLANRNVCSRREADDWIKKGWVFVNSVKAEMGMKVNEDDNIELHVSARKNMDEKLNILLHKPYSFISQSTERNSSRRRRFAKDLLSFRNQDRKCSSYRKIKHQPYKMRKLACAGRLDAESAGLLIFTQNGKLAKSIISSREKEKEYIVTVTPKSFEMQDDLYIDHRIELLMNMSDLDGKPIMPIEVNRIEPSRWRPEPRLDLWPESHRNYNEEDSHRYDQLRMILREGKYHQIRRMCDKVGLNVLALVRIRIGNLELGKLRSGFWRTFDESEL